MVKRCLGNEIADCFTKSFATAASNFWIAFSAKDMYKGLSRHPKEEGGNFGLAKLFYESFQFRTGSMHNP